MHQCDENKHKVKVQQRKHYYDPIYTPLSYSDYSDKNE